ncbi:MAG: ABC transporter permease [Desulfurococcales archaeon]|nr:ABC transporter permease [Desulfurococcales archaeon]
MNLKPLFFIGKRLASMALIVVGVVIILFFLLHLAPGNPAQILAGFQATPEVVHQIEVKYGLDKPLYVQLMTYLTNMIRLDLGTSIMSQRPVTDEIMARLPNSLMLATVAIVEAIAISLPLGVLAAAKAGSRFDAAVTAFTSIGVALPTFWTGLMLMLLFAVELHLLPAGGIGGPQNFILPSITMAVPISAPIIRVTRNAALEVLEKPFVKLAIAKGLSMREVLMKHVLKNALIPAVTLIGLQFGVLIRSAVITETVFAWPGIGKLLVDSIFARDYPLVQGTVFVIAIIYVAINLALDVAYVVIDPRLRSGVSTEWRF